MATIRELAERVGLPFEGDGALEVRRVRGLQTAGPGDLSFVQSQKFREQAEASPVQALIVPETMELPGKTVIRSPNPHLTLVELTPALHPPRRHEPGIDPRAAIGPGCRIAASATVGPCAVLEANVAVGERSVIGAGCFLGEGVTIGADTELRPNVTVEWGCTIGDRVLLLPGAVIGARGFGFIPHEGRHVPIPQIGNVIIEDDVEIGANSCVDRATYESSVIEAGSKIDNLVMVGHNCRIGAYSILASQTGISGSTVTGKYFLAGGQAGVSGHLDIPDQVTVAPKSGMVRPGRTGEIYAGYPARPFRQWKRTTAAVNALPKLAKRLRSILPELGEAEGEEDED